ncbi:MAG: biopolymer transporter ExbD [Hyphomonadaceae bacterium]|nr:biopolymer transporter ExbD [Hyphomonadaceae bacterium]MBC6411531.1 biopolymer transporter ExbD [Hyphomonadaceae bacterium]
MKRRKKFENDEAAVDMTPMLDIVFIMLIFFIVTATFLDERGIDLTQPPPPPDDDMQPNPKPAITIYVDKRNVCAVDNRQTECDRVSLAVERLLADKPGANVILRVHAQAKHDLLVALKDGLDDSGLRSKIEIVRG